MELTRFSAVTSKFKSNRQDTESSVNLHSTLELWLNSRYAQTTSEELKIITENHPGFVKAPL